MNYQSIEGFLFCDFSGYISPDYCLEPFHQKGVFVKKGASFPIVGYDNGINVLIGKFVFNLLTFEADSAGCVENSTGQIESPVFSFVQRSDIGDHYQDFDYFKYD